MASIGKRNRLTVLRSAPPGYYLDAGELGEVLLPGALIPPGVKVGDALEVFLYRDSEDRLVTTTELPYAQVGEFACLRVAGLSPRIGVFLDMGLAKDLLLPMRELKTEAVRTGDWLIVFVMLDERTQRLMASERLQRHLRTDRPDYAEGQAVKLLVAAETPLGYRVIVEDGHTGLLYRTDLSGPLGKGERLDGFVRSVRADGKLDLALDLAGHTRIDANAERVMTALAKAGGRLPFHDDSSPEEIREAFGMSKKAFKQAIGALFKERRIVITAHGIRVASVEK
ncbi:MAG: S1-like domain-containing RNA-binding protein [Verrucomicrobiota bacterium]